MQGESKVSGDERGMSSKDVCLSGVLGRGREIRSSGNAGRAQRDAWTNVMSP